ncbi:MAG: hypothetical protein CGU28_09780 [Candidatus Dactylopiibacterium carminicum]|uniref:Uncharacterized protein n=1 Tax=Candidatus Dactylopiibacterium carminicum TaxID=857335 RepID=A0A272ERJ4_9RHOO|nr:hypothetical protein [Candidatus Dactylopiibacterium carminicum]KAF7598832.1 hypothetical protein BGI27_11280 [Candidatus Dactylopiibacterium carminicum]PAS92712.1 MAG: hypothetical protein CGU29_10370 [Candidatus Dactylopiibacterium carminicum]PAS96161.1 MAG: hypothetical protein CGU28_09780 [Candidatus Dactylopiibacterium carminicum]PAS98851.1 MAG: hypothetical protein BSR46_11295 [Candidatus Dactylopiibacterium carminicum]
MSQVANRRAALLAFDADWYLARYPDVALTGLPPFVHFERYGQPLGRLPCADWQIGAASHLPKADACELAFSASHQVLPD